MVNKLVDFKNKTIELKEISNIYNVKEHDDIVKLVNSLIDNEIIKPIKSADKTAMIPRIPKKYKIIFKKEEKNLKDELIYKIHPLLSIDFYKNNIELYKKHKDVVLKLNEYLKNNYDLLNIPVSINERSYEIFNDEKFLKDNTLAVEILKNLNFSIEKLNVYRTPEPLCKNPKNKKVLIIENKDTFFTIKRILLENENFEIMGEKIGCVIYGEGKKIHSSILDIENSLRYQNVHDLEFLYWGDIDKEGFWIYSKLIKIIPGYKISLFKNAYYEMIKKSKEIGFRKGKVQSKQYKDVLLEFDKPNREYIEDIIDKGFYIPQEILSFRTIFKEYPCIDKSQK